MRIVILGSGAGGGVPQWNCGCRNCEAARAGRIPAMSQSGIAVSANGRDWALVNASPDLRQQLAATPALRPGGLRGSPIRSVLVTNGDIDHVAGLLTLREGQGFDLFATPAIHDVLAANPMLAALDPRLVARRPVALEQGFDLAPGLVARLFAVPGKVPLYLEGERVETELMGEQTVGVELAAGGRRVFYIPGCASVPGWLRDRIAGADALLFDGTLWTDDEMLRAGLGAKTGRRMGHVPVSGPGGSLEALRDLALGARIYVHLNNSNPLVDPASPERAQAQAAGWQVGHDGMEIAP
ncbi:pyrroloquinoline quinone biosynthesis protein PqqB [Paracoccus versutus]|uniref:Coenzyme PQQ synthesis protein B n=1 Tax=Paracoccus versutus TaxID=34007 RepID=A0AAQ0HL32_PARVE|nr:pyrroloquinoline quinone biosynthesis protein PqqB [Paracoccus versutus]KGJ09372.1 pyrroloquinoline quinone biosynthesis protein PqqB [Paracoccus versutus]REG52524.1 pyrroloquinoline quinone biosynthesis protein B [Paracoccus versutus]WEJ78783.1 pyrroloquinoline quinone biosynthesis protein PqqB [Paracoccus versutus]